MILTEEDRNLITESIAKYPEKRPAVMDALRHLQLVHGHIPKKALPELSEILEMPEKDISGIISFYTMYTEEKRGKFHFQICTNVSCALRGGKEIFNAVSERLNLKNNQTSEDGLFSIEEMECMGACGGAPMLAVNDKFYENTSIEEALEIIENIKSENA